MVQKFDTRKIYKLSNEVIFSPPFLSVSPFLLLNLVRRQCFAYAIGLYTRPDKKGDQMLNFVLMRIAFCRGVENTRGSTLDVKCCPMYRLRKIKGLDR